MVKRTFLYTVVGEQTITREYEQSWAARIPLAWIGDSYFETSGENRYTTLEFANTVVAWSRSRGLSLSDEVLRDLPNKNNQQVAIITKFGRVTEIEMSPKPANHTQISSGQGACVSLCGILDRPDSDLRRTHLSCPQVGRRV